MSILIGCDLETAGLDPCADDIQEILSELRGLIEGLEAVERRMSALAEECFDEPTQPNLALTEALAEGM